MLHSTCRSTAVVGSRFWRSSALKNPSFFSTFVSATKPIVTGRATTEGTQKFILSAALPLHHRFEQSNLYISPIIHGAPSFYDDDNQGYVEALTMRAVIKNKSNCLVVYENQLHKSLGPSSVNAKTPQLVPSQQQLQPYYFNGLGTVLREGNLTRDQIVTMANLGTPGESKEGMIERFDEAIKLSRLEHIDFAYFEISDQDIVHRSKSIESALEAMRSLFNDKRIQSFGIKVSVSPYKYHTPPPDGAEASELVSFPYSLEDEMTRGYGQGCDMVIYPISPSITIPTTYPMLDANRSVWVDQEKKSDELQRKFTRIACDPLTCRQGTGLSVNESDEVEIEMISGLLDERIEKHLAHALDTLCPALESTPKLQDKALRLVFSVGVDVVMLDAETSGIINKFSLQHKDMVSSDDSEAVFGGFLIPPNNPLVNKKPSSKGSGNSGSTSGSRGSRRRSSTRR